MSDPNISLTKKVIHAVTQGRGLRGYNVIIDVSDAGMIQWRQDYTGAPWNDIIALADLIGPQGDAAHVHIKWHAEDSTALLDTPDAYIGIYADNTAADSAVYATYKWFKYKGDKGDAAPNTIWQYKTEGGEWTTDATGAVYERQSGDNGVTWSAAHEYPGVAALNAKANVTDVNAALALKAPLASPTFTGDVVVPDQTAGNNSTKAANTKYADAKVADAINDGVTGIAPSQNAVFNALALKADASDVADALALKADVTYVDAELALKADVADVDDALALKADAGDVADALALKADADAVINALESSVDKNIPIFDGIAGDKLKDSGVKLSDKADTSAVTAGLLLKADLTYVEYLMMEGDPA